MLDQLLQEWDTLTRDLVWQPHPANRPQVQAYLSDAFETLYGGAAGGGKSDLLLGLARTMHRRSLLLRRTFPDLERSLISRSLEFYGDTKAYNASKHIWNIEGRRIEFGHMERIGTPQVPGDEAQYASAPYDLIAWDQLEQFMEYAYVFMLSRARSADGRRVRVIASANPVGEGVEWIMRRWRAWLVDKIAKPGEILWYRTDEEGNDVQTTKDHPDAVSRTFIPAGLADNPYLTDDYRRSLMLLTEPLRSALLSGNWAAMLTDDAYQVIPRAWVQAAMKRWTDRNLPPSIIGADIARGGEDKMVLAPRNDYWFDELQKYPGRDITSGAKGTKPIIEFLEIKGLAKRTDKEIEYRDDGFSLPIVESKTPVNVDVIGIGSSVYDTCRTQGVDAVGVNFSEKSIARDKSETLRFVNKRAEFYWAFREALDPDDNSTVELPPDTELEADLCAPRWQSMSNGIKIESKEDIKKRIGRSPDCADAVVLSWGGAPTWYMI
jgi:hypothetical protein